MSTENKDTESTSDTPIQAGALTQLLSQYRTDARLGHEQVSEALCLPVSSVKALENEEFDKLPESPYIRGYLRTYSRLAGQDPAEAIKIYDTLHGGSSSSTKTYNYTLNKGTEKTKKSTFSELGARLIVLALLLSVLGLVIMHPTINQWIQKTWNSFSSEQVNNDNSLPGENLIDPRALAGDIPGNLPVSDKVDEQKKPDTENAVERNQASDAETITNDTATTDSETQDTTNTNSTDSAENQDTNTAEENETPQEKNAEADNEPTENNTEPEALEAGKVKLKLVFSDEVWIRIQNNKKKTVFEALNSADTEKELTLTPPLRFKVGSAHGLKIYVNGKEKDITEYTKGSIARFNIEKAQPNETENTNANQSTE